MLAAIEDLLKRRMGLDGAAIGSSAIERAVQQRCAACRLPGIEAYWELVCASDIELQELIEAVVVPETWFFRDPEAFGALARTVWSATASDGREHPWRLLSLPSSTGEEPYSMAMALLDAAIPAERFHVVGVDISTRAVMRARHAAYGRNSFRGNDLGFRERHFESTPHGWQLSAAVRQQVGFREGNLFDPGFLANEDGYDVIFCRNLLIYFDRPTQDRAIAILSRLLRADGYLFVGASETGLLHSHGFASTRVPLAFSFRKPEAPPRTPIAASPPSPRSAAPPVRRTGVRRMEGPAPSGPPARRAGGDGQHGGRPVRRAADAPAVPASPGVAGLTEARRLADQGVLVEAARQCEAHLKSQGPSADAFHLLGLVRDAAGNHAEAASFYRKALYLEPQHYEALVHLAALLESRGDHASARVLHDRAKRFASKPRK